MTLFALKIKCWQKQYFDQRADKIGFVEDTINLLQILYTLLSFFRDS